MLCKFVHASNVETIYRHVTEPMVTYAAGIWGDAADRPSVKRQLRSFQRSFAIRAIRAFHTVSAVSAIALAQFMPLHLKVQEVRDTQRVKSSGSFEGLPDDVVLETRVKPARLLHPARRIGVKFSLARTESDVESASSHVNIYTDGSKLDDDSVGAGVVKLTSASLATKLPTKRQKKQQPQSALSHMLPSR